MILSMTGFGNAEGIFNGKKYTVELKSLNNRFFEIAFKSPKQLNSREIEIKEFIRSKVSRGKINITLLIENGEGNDTGFNSGNMKEYIKILKTLKKSIGSKEKIKLDHVLNLSKLVISEPSAEISPEEFEFIMELISKAADKLLISKSKEGEFIKNDLLERLNIIEEGNRIISRISAERIPEERIRLKEKVENLMVDKCKIDENRLELEIILLAEKLDITEESKRLECHTEYYKECVLSEDHAGRKLNFLIQEMNREINTMASKSNDSQISQRVSVLKEELEKIREQVQNIE
jgi:uncharacterized protein (TIGR00255 family)